MTHLPSRIAAKIAHDVESGCWVWTAAIMKNGYGVESTPPGGGSRLAHRVVYGILVGDPGPKLDHRCFNRACVNPEHLRPTTNKQNLEHREGLNLNNASGVRGVSWHRRDKRWRVLVRHDGRQVHGGYFTDLRAAEQAAIALRARLFTHDDGRIAS